MCLSFSSLVLRYKNLLCNASVIQRITKKVSGNPDNLSCESLPVSVKRSTFCTRNRERCGTSDSVTDLVKQTWEIFLDSDLHLVSYLSGAKGARTDKTSGGWVVRLLWKFRKKTFQKKLSKTFGGYDKISYLCIRFRKRWQTGIGVL